jgi:hypothetical protein
MATGKSPEPAGWKARATWRRHACRRVLGTFLSPVKDSFQMHPACSGMENKTCRPPGAVLHCFSEVSVSVQFGPGAFMHFLEREVHGR